MKNKRRIQAIIVLLILAMATLLSELGVISFTGFWKKNSNSVVAYLAQKTNEVRFRKKESLTWDSADVNSGFHNGDSVKTEDQSTAWINFKDNTQIFLNPNTLIEIGESGAAMTSLSLNLGQGSYQILLGSNSFKLGDTTVRGVGKARLVVSRDSIVLADGQAFYSKPGQPEQAFNSGTSVADLGSSTGVAPTWMEPSANMVYYTTDDSVVIPFKWASSPEQFTLSNLAITPAKDFNFKVSGRDSMYLKVYRGTYLAQLLSPGGKSSSLEIRVLPAPVVTLKTPTAGGRLQPKTKFAISWKKNPAFGSYIWEVSRDKNFRTIAATGETENTRAQVNGLNYGKFFWRVRGKDPQGFNIPTKVARGFRVGNLRMVATNWQKEPPTVAPPQERSVASVPEATTTEKIDEVQVKEAGGPPTAWVALGLGGNYLNYGQTVPGANAEVSYESLKPVSVYGEAGATISRKWKAAASYHDSPGQVSSSPSIPVSNGSYHWKTYSGEGFYELNEDMFRVNGKPVVLDGRFGVQYHSMPFIVVQSSTRSVDIRENTLTMATIGANATLGKWEKFSYEVFGRYQYPVSAAGSGSNSFKVSPNFAFDGSMGGLYRLSNVTLGAFWYGQWHVYNFNYTDGSTGTSNSGRQSLFYSNVEFRLGYEF